MTIIVIIPEVAFSLKRAKINELLYLLGNDAKKNEAAEQLLIERDQAIQDAYEFTYGVAIFDELDRWYTNNTHHIACEIIALKERYSKRIKRCRIRHERFKQILDDLPVKDSETLIRAFCTSIEVDERDVKAVIGKHFDLIKSYYQE